jgi:hypothetical protein
MTYTVLAVVVRVRGPNPTANGDPGTEVKAPVEESNENAATELPPVNATYKKLLLGVVAANPGVERVDAGNAIGWPTEINVPVVEFIAKPATLKLPTTNKNLPAESVTAWMELGTTASDELEMDIKDPLLATENPEIVPVNPTT